MKGKNEFWRKLIARIFSWWFCLFLRFSVGDILIVLSLAVIKRSMGTTVLFIVRLWAAQYK
jgi:hypothetical protein